jgi:hypothetical protein
VATEEQGDQPRFIDLDSVSAGLGSGNAYKALNSLVRRYRDAMSALNDLRECQEYLDVLREHDPLPQPTGSQQYHHAVSGALLSQAIILYVRATKTKSKHRTFVPVAQKLPAALGRAHKLMIALRDNAIAHYGPGSAEKRPAWVREKAALRVFRERASMRLLYSRVAIQTDLPNDLQHLVDHARQILVIIAEERAADLLEEVKRLHDSDPDFRTLASTNDIDLSGFFDGDAAAVAQTLAQAAADNGLAQASYQRSTFSLS